MNLPSSKPETPPVAIDEINALVGVQSHFQTDRNFNKNYASDEQAETLGDLSTVCLNFATTTSEAGGFGAVSRVVAYGKSSKFLLFGLNANQADVPGVRIFGVKSDAGADEKELIKEINALV